jgi:hypothetical protein
MKKQITIALLLCCSVAFPLAAPADDSPSEASIKQLLEVSQARKMLDDTATHLETFLTQTLQQATQGEPIPDSMQKQIDEARAEMRSVWKEVLDWSKIEPMYVRVYQKSLTQQEVNDLIAMYQTPGARVLTDKGSILMQNSMTEMQQLIQPLMARIQSKSQEIAAEIKSKKQKSGS